MSLVIFYTSIMFYLFHIGSERIFRLEAPVEKCYRRTDSNRQRLIHKAKMKSLRISVVIVCAFIICWTPYYVMMIIFMFLNPDKRVSNVLCLLYELSNLNDYGLKITT